jgi:hypothetical protein
VFKQPAAEVPVTVYVVVVVGLTVTEAPDKLPGFQVYVAAPDAVSVADPPTQTEEFEAVAVTVGNPLTVTKTVAVFTQPGPFEPVTV